jgi:hypothetical protein
MHDGSAPKSPRRRASDLERPLIALWLLLPACVWWIGFGADSIRGRGSAVFWRPVLLILSLWFLWGLWTIRSRRAGAIASPAGRDRLASPLATIGTALYLLAGAGFLILLGPGIAPVRQPIARGLLGALMIACAWIGWTALHPIARRLPFRLLGSIRRAR